MGDREDGWYCAACLRLFAQGLVRVEPGDQTTFTVWPADIYSCVAKYGTKRFIYINGAVPLFACTMVNGEYRCPVHVDLV